MMIVSSDRIFQRWAMMCPGRKHGELVTPAVGPPIVFEEVSFDERIDNHESNASNVDDTRKQGKNNTSDLPGPNSQSF